MPRRNLYLLFGVALVSLACYHKANSAYRSHYGRMFDTFVQVLKQIDQHYIEEVDERVLFEGALEGLVGRLDPYSAYIRPKEAAEFQETLDSKFGGIGIEVSWDPETKLVTVLSPLVGTPAYEKGILAGDKILRINGENAEGFKPEDAAGRLRGKPGESVRLTILREGRPEPIELELERAIIEVETVLGDTRAPDGRWDFFLQGHNKIGYVRITSFGPRTVQELRAALVWLTERDMRGLVLDLRTNAGGLLEEAVATCDMLIPAGRIVSTRGRDKVDRRTFDASGKGLYTKFPLVVLVNRFTASASEIVAACLQDHRRAVVVGQRTWGKGTVQDVISLEQGKSVLKLTTASYWRPSGKDIHRRQDAKPQDDWGVVPNEGFEVNLTDAEVAKLMDERRRRDVVKPPAASQPPAAEPQPVNDPQLQKAVQSILEQLAPARPRAA